MEGSQSTVLSAKGLVKSYGAKTVVRDLSFDLKSGEVLGLLGPNGAGKTTVLGMLYGSVLPESGEAWLHPEQIALASRPARRHLGVVTQNNNLDPDFTVFENLILFAHHYRLHGAAAHKRSGQLLEMVGLTEYAKYRIDELSGGMQRRLVLARALISAPRILFLDEPTTGFDPDARQDFWKIILDLRQAGTSVLLTTHYMDEAERLCDRLLLMQQGREVDQGSPAELIEKIIGGEVLEIEGISQDELVQLLPDPATRVLPFGKRFLLKAPQDDSLLWQRLAAGHSTRLTRRKANLEDVFLSLTGTGLQ